jgi:hypothetical protein
MSGTISDPGKCDTSSRWAALDSRYERLASDSDRTKVKSDDTDRTCDLKAAS